MTLIITHNEQEHQFIASVEGKACILKYTVLSDGKTLDYYSTFVPRELRGQRISQDLTKVALEFAKENHYKVIPSCPVVEQFIERHPEYKSLISSET